MNGIALSPLLLSPWLFGLGVLVQTATLYAASLLSNLGPLREGSLAWPVAWAMAALLWWLMHAPRLCATADRLIRLRAPGVVRTLAPALLLHLGLSMVLPWICLLVWPPESDPLQLVAALWLGAATGALMMSMPIVLGFVPAMLIGYGWPIVADPLASAALGTLVWLMTAWLWFAHARRPRNTTWMPAGATFQRTESTVWRQADHAGQQPAEACLDQRRLDNMAAVLGRSCQTLRQIYGWRGWALFHLWVLATCAFVLWLGPTYDDGFLFASQVFCMVFIVLQPSRALAQLHAQRRAAWADLYVLPGLPAAGQLQAAIMRQVRRSMAERGLAMAALALCMGADRVAQDFRWVVFVVGFSLLVWCCGLLMARLAWRGRLGGVAMYVINAMLMLAGIITCVLLMG
ncbi:hypothetical protein J2W83_003021 [Pseudomonas hunanensis]|uniref:Uncharacterized protein n=1 Tax=Pseudomonas hunanensis TaxID=1247546 RepID=A0ACC6K4M5_9PSED|nr:hypothetical protein [Pseudomonas hunanensis]MDR6713413.1 hypothetical protein [Pseudomonas hunanensis]